MTMLLKLAQTGRQVCTGATPTPRHKLGRAYYAGRHLEALPAPPGSVFNTAKVLTLWDIAGNSTYGDCVSAEERNAKLVISSATGAAPVIIPGANCVSWARKNGDLNGADLSDVVNQMVRSGMQDAAGVVHNDGSFGPGTVDYSNQVEMMLAIQWFKTLKIGVSSRALEGAVTNSNGWYLGTARSGSQDHCVGLYDYGPASFLAQSYGVTLPSSANPTDLCFGLYTWGTIGIVTWSALQSIIGEAWVRINDPDRGDAAAWDQIAKSDFSQLTLPPGPPTPTPTPVPTPTPTPTPIPVPSGMLTVAAATQAIGPIFSSAIAAVETRGIVSGVGEALDLRTVQSECASALQNAANAA